MEVTGCNCDWMKEEVEGAVFWGIEERCLFKWVLW